MSELRANTISDLAGTGPVTLMKQSAAKAWVNFNGTGTVAKRGDGFNVSSITDNGTGDYTVNFTTAMSDVDYTSGVSGDRTGNNNGTFGDHNYYYGGTPVSTTSARGFSYGTSAFVDSAVICVSNHGDLA